MSTTSTRYLLAAVILCFGAGPAQAEGALPVPLPRAHSHNDYERPRPLWDALDHGFCSIEADIHLVDDQLLVGHDREDVQPDRTLQSLYLEPLRKRAEQNAGRIYPEGPTIILLIDIKTDAESTYSRLDNVLREYAGMLTRFTEEGATPGAVTVVISGNRPVALVGAQQERFAALDGRQPDTGADARLYPLVSMDWRSFFTWNGKGKMPEDEAGKLRVLLNRAHAAGQKVRFWGLPLWPDVWPALYEAGVDLLNSDHPDKLQAFLLTQMQKHTSKKSPVPEPPGVPGP